MTSLAQSELQIYSPTIYQRGRVILPGNSAAGLQESNDDEVELQLVTDAQWEKGKGSYISICFVHTHNEGLIGAKQETVEVV